MAADIILGVSKIVQPNVSSCLLEAGVDVVSCALTEGDVEWVIKIENASGGGSSVRENMVYAASKRFDGAVDAASTFLMDTFTFDAILLVWHPDGSFSSHEEDFQWGSVGDKAAIGLSKGDVHDPEGDCVGPGVAGSGVFSNP